MRRNNRIKNNNNSNKQNKILMYSIIGIALLTIVLVGLLMYSKSLSDKVERGTINIEEMAKANEQNLQNTTSESASSEIGKTVEEMKNETNNNTLNISSNTTKEENVKSNNQTKENTNKATVNTTKNEKTNNTTKKTEGTEKKTENKKELSFAKPVEGDIVKEYAKDNLIYSNTLQEWTTHLGIDIKAEKTTVVKSAEKGTIKSIKNDPRYGLTIVIEHDNGYQTVYSNLLSSEFVVEGEKVEKGQSVGTVGNTAAFEVADEPHLHFEILKDNVQVDPNIYLK